VKDIQNYRLNWKQHVDRIRENRLPKKLLNYKPMGMRGWEGKSLEGPVLNFWTQNGFDSTEFMSGKRKKKR
jgi:hypothetical protein